MDARDEIKQRLSVEEVVGDYLPLKRAGRNLKALSPFTSEKTPSFMVSPEKQIWHDFSSNKGGDIFTFVMEMEGVDFVGAMEILARRANVDLSQYQRGDGRVRKQKERILEAHQLAAKYYHATLAKNKTALSYVIKERGYSKQIISEFEIGYAPKKGDALSTFLAKKGFSTKEMRDSGLLAARGKRNLDMFRGRIVLPLKDGQGRTVGFTGRVLDDGLPKYLNTPQTLVYDKSSNVYGLSQAKEAIREDKFVVIVEGNLDVVAAHMAGTKNVVAVAGTAMTRRHLTQLGRLAEDVRLAFDADEAGFNATLRAIPMAQESGASLSIINIKGGKDPDDIIKASPARWKAMIKRSQYVVDWVIEQLETRYDLSSAKGKREFSSQALQVITGLADAVEKDHYVEELANKLNISANALREKLDKTPDKSPRLGKRKPKGEDPEAHVSTYQDLLIGLMMRYPDVREGLEQVKAEQFQEKWRQDLVRYLLKTDRKPLLKTPKNLQEYDTYVNIALLRTEELYGPWSASDRMIESIGLARRLLNDYKKTKKQELTEAISDAEKAGDDDKRVRLLKEFDALIKGEENAQTTSEEEIR